jgi:RHS repeat-associated protein
VALAEVERSSSPLPLAAMASPVSVTWPRTGYGNKAYTGREWDAEVGLHYYRARYYDPKVGRFLSEDPIPIPERRVAELNAYPYVANNPVNRTDPEGQAFIDCCKVLAELTAATAKLAQRIAENAANPDPGHNKAIRELSNRVARLAAQAAKSCGEAGKAAASAAAAALARARTIVVPIIIIDPCVIDPGGPGCIA